MSRRDPTAYAEFTPGVLQFMASEELRNHVEQHIADDNPFTNPEDYLAALEEEYECCAVFLVFRKKS